MNPPSSVREERPSRQPMIIAAGLAMLLVIGCLCGGTLVWYACLYVLYAGR